MQFGIGSMLTSAEASGVRSFFGFLARVARLAVRVLRSLSYQQLVTCCLQPVMTIFRGCPRGVNRFGSPRNIICHDSAILAPGVVGKVVVRWAD
jgi:hypothetical protein